ncbi:anoctamin-7-like isoform X2 [Convolutriloba macropyga]|uniref:anoctamin-7-like isoform X2 n=1 Tax=Convolutriloba macropyga TaxID=536237 RepID=UPI003F525193
MEGIEMVTEIISPNEVITLEIEKLREYFELTKLGRGSQQPTEVEDNWNDKQSVLSIPTDEISIFSTESSGAQEGPSSSEFHHRKTTSSGEKTRTPSRFQSDMGHFTARNNVQSKLTRVVHDDKCSLCKNVQLAELMKQSEHQQYGLHFLNERIRQHIRPPKPALDDMPHLVNILNSAANQQSKPENPSVSDSGNDLAQFEEKAFDNISQRCYFNDKKRKIDFVLAYSIPKDMEDSEEDRVSEHRDTRHPHEIEEENKRSEKRESFLLRLEECGIQIEEAQLDDWDEIIVFYKLHVPFPLMAELAEELNIRIPLQLKEGSSDVSEEWSAQIVDQYFPSFIPNILAQKVPNAPRKHLTATFTMENLKKFSNHDTPHKFFNNRHRIRIAHEILKSTPWGKEDKAEIGIEALLIDKVFTAAYPLHDGPHEVPEVEAANDNPELLNTLQSGLNARQVLFQFWAWWRKWHKYQPIHHVREYYGEHVAFYFYFLGFYTAWLLPAAVFGFIAQICAIFYALNNPVAEDICNTQYDMCPLCDVCEIWSSDAMCLFSTLGAAFDNQFTISNAIFLSIWSVLFLEYWKRNCAQIGVNWEVYDYVPLEERPRPKYVKECRETKRNPVNGRMEPHFPTNIATTRRRVAGIVIIFMLCWVGALVFCTVVVRSYTSVFVASLDMAVINDNNLAPVIANTIGSIVQGVGMAILSFVYDKVVFALTEWEVNRTEGEFQQSLALKKFIFAFCSSYVPIMYISFFKGKWLGTPVSYTRIFSARLENCPNSDCLWEMAMQLIVFFAAKQWIQNFMEAGVPVIETFIRRKIKLWQKKGHEEKLASSTNQKTQKQSKRKKKSSKHKSKRGSVKSSTSVRRSIGNVDEDQIVRPQWEEDYFLTPNPGLFPEYLELMIQFGFITIFACAFPIGPLLACLNNWLEIRLDAYKYTCVFRRPVPERSKDIGFWYSILAVFSTLCVISNAYLICFTSYYLDKAIYNQLHPYDHGLDHFYQSILTNFTILDEDTNQMQECWFLNYGYYDAQGHRSPYFWKVMAIKLMFAIVYVFVILSIGRVMDVMIDDIPEEVELKIRKEAYLARQVEASSTSGSQNLATTSENFFDNQYQDIGLYNRFNVRRSSDRSNGNKTYTHHDPIDDDLL